MLSRHSLKTIRPIASKLAPGQAYVSGSRLYSSDNVRNPKSDIQNAIKMIDDVQPELFSLKFTDLHGTWMGVQFAMSEFDESAFTDGFYFDGSSVRGWQSIDESDMLLMPIARSVRLNPFTKRKTVWFTCDILDPFTKETYHKDPRAVAIKSVEHLRSTGIAHDCYIGPEAEFFVLDGVSYSSQPNKSSYELFSSEAGWGTGEEHTANYKIRPKEGYFPVAPWDTLQDVRSDMVATLVDLGIPVEASHHEVASAGQCEIDVRFNELVTMCDYMQIYKFVIRNVSGQHNKLATFMPKPIATDNGSGMHTHVSLHEKDGTNLFLGDGYAQLSDMALYFTGGLIKHAKSVCAFSNPTINSYKRLVPGFEAPVNMAYSARNRSVSIRIPASNPKAKRIEFRTPDPSCNPYLSASAILQAGLDGIKNEIHPGEPLDKDIYSLTPEELQSIPHAPTSLEDAMNALEQDHDFLTAGGVFSEDLIETWINRKRELEIEPVRKQPTPLEFEMYFDC